MKGGPRAPWAGVAAAVVRTPRVWAAAARQIARLAVPGWWRQWPPVPRPDGAYLAFRMVTQYGAPDASPTPGDVVSYLDWCRQMRAVTV